MEKVLAPAPQTYCVAYLDDLLVDVVDFDAVKPLIGSISCY